MRELASSSKHTVLADHDDVYLRAEDGRTVLLGWMYGNAQAACFHPKDEWVVVSGCGLWVIRLPLAPNVTVDTAPTLSLRAVLNGEAAAHSGAAFVCLMDDPHDSLWPEAISLHPTDPEVVRFVADLDSEYELHVPSLQVRKRL